MSDHEGLNLLPNFQKGGKVTRPQFLEGIAGKKGVTFFRRGCNFYTKNKLKSGIFNENVLLCHN